MSCISYFMQIHPAIQSLIQEIDTFRASVDMSASAFGTQALNDANFISDLLNGREPSFRTIDKVRNFMRERENAA